MATICCVSSRFYRRCQNDGEFERKSRRFEFSLIIGYLEAANSGSYLINFGEFNGQKKAVLIGASGAIGSHVVKYLMQSNLFSEVVSFGRRELVIDNMPFHHSILHKT